MRQWPERWKTRLLSKPLLCFLLTFIHMQRAAVEDDLQPPLPVTIRAHSMHSVSLAWALPERSNDGIYVTGTSIHYSSSTESEKVIHIAANETQCLVTKLSPGQNYTAFITAHYSNNRSSSSEKFVMSTLPSAIGLNYKDCTCTGPGFKRCERAPAGGRCMCNTGYEGLQCDICSDKYYPEGDKCTRCPCKLETSLGTCKIGTDSEIVCDCKKGYQGAACDTCWSGFYPVNHKCIPCECLNCQEHNMCEQCPEYAHEISEQDKDIVMAQCNIQGPPKSPNQTTKHEDGTVAIVAVVLSLAFIGCVAGGVTGYRRCLQARNQVPFWSIELAEDKVSLNASSDYQRLERSSKLNTKNGHQRSSSVAEATVAQRTADQPQYNCISI